MTKPSSIDTLSEDEQFVLIEMGKAMERASRHGEDARQPLPRLAAVEPHHQFLLLLRS